MLNVELNQVVDIEFKKITSFAVDLDTGSLLDIKQITAIYDLTNGIKAVARFKNGAEQEVNLSYRYITDFH